MPITERPKDPEDLFSSTYANILFIIAKQNGAMRESVLTDGSGKKETIKYVLLDPAYDWTATGKGEHPFTGGFVTIEYDLSYLVKSAVDEKITGFFCGKDKFFVVPQNVPEEFIGCVLAHEATESEWAGVGERSTMDVAHAMLEDGVSDDEITEFMEREMEYARKFPHMEGCSAELETTFDEGEEFAKRYSEWLLETNGDTGNTTTFFNQILPGF